MFISCISLEILAGTRLISVRLPAPPSVANGGTVTSLMNTVTNAPEIWYIGQDQHVHSIIYNTITGWATYDLNTYSGLSTTPAPANAGLTVLVDSLNFRNEAYYVGTDQHIHQFYWVNGVCWCTFDVSAFTGAPPAALGGGITSVVDTLNNQLEVYYVSTDQHVWQLGWNAANGWFKFDVTAFTGAPLVISGGALTSLVDTLDSGLEVYYLGNDQVIHQLQWTAANGWRQFTI